MIFLGDVTRPPGVPMPIVDFGPDPCVVLNLEGSLLEGPPPAGRVALSNAPEMLDELVAQGTRAVVLANNHFTDVDPWPRETFRLLESRGIGWCGAGRDLAEASAPCVLEDRGVRVALLSFGWEPIGCPPAGRRKPGVNPLEPAHVLDSIRHVRRRHPDARIVAFMHWDYELELYPQPLHRRLAFSAIDEGASAVVGCHSHLVQGYESHRGAPIVYGLGNWFLPPEDFSNGRIVYPQEARLQLAFEWSPADGAQVCHWFEMDPKERRLIRLGPEEPSGSGRLKERTPFLGMPHDEYGKWFAAHRRKRLLLPVYDDDTRAWKNRLRDGWVRLRAVMLERAFLAGLKGGPR